MVMDRMQGVPVIDHYDAEKLEAGIHRFYFRAGASAFGVYHLLPLIVIKGANPGPKLFVQSSLHGDEVQGIDIIHSISEGLSPEQLSGVLTLVPGANPSGLGRGSRYFSFLTDGFSQTDLNRVMPGDEAASDAAGRFAAVLWNHLYAGNAHVFLDLHTQSTGTAYPFFVFADRRNPIVDHLVKLVPADLIANDPGEDGTVETEMLKAGIPALTLEVGAPRIFDRDMTRRGAQAIRNIMIDQQMIEGTADMLGATPYCGDQLTSIRARIGGISRIKAELNQWVDEGQELAEQVNPFGDVQETYVAPHAGRVASIATDPLRAPGALLVRLLK